MYAVFGSDLPRRRGNCLTFLPHPLALARVACNFFRNLGRVQLRRNSDAIWADLVAIWVTKKLRKLSFFDFSRPFRDLPPLVLELALAPRRPRKACPHRSEMRGTRRADMCELVRLQAAHKLRLAGHDELCLAVMTAHLHPSAIHNPGGLPRCVPCPCPVRTPHVLCACRSALIVAGPTRLPAHARPKARRL